MTRNKFWVQGFALMIRARKAESFLTRLRRKATGYRRGPGPNTMPRVLPKTIWIYWDKGEDAAPEMVRLCIASWRARNPDWTVRVLSAEDADQIGEMPDLPPDIPVQSYADLLRLRLLARHGGVWADATLYCVTPLDHWLPALSQKGFFAFTWTEADRWMIWPDVRRAITNWFLAAEPGGTVISRWEAKSFDYWEGRQRPHIYYWPHMLVDYLVSCDPVFRAAYAEMPRLGCYAPHLVHDCVTGGAMAGKEDEVRALITAGVSPVQKLRWNWTGETAVKAQALLGVGQGS